MNLKKIKDSLDTDKLLEIWEGKSTEEIADELWDNFGSNWCSDEFDFINRELVADGFERFIDKECDTLSDFEDICEYVDANDLFQHLSLDEKESMLEYYGYEDEEDEEEEEEEEEEDFEEIFRNDSFDIYVDNDSSFGKVLRVIDVQSYEILARLELEYFEIPNYLQDLNKFCSALKGKLDKDTADALVNFLLNYMENELDFDLAKEINEYEKEVNAGENDLYDSTSEYLEDEFGIDIDWFTVDYYIKK